MAEQIDYVKRWKNVPAKRAQEVYNTARQAVIRKVTDPAARQRQLARFDSDPRVQAIRQRAGLQPVMTKKQAIAETAKRVAKEKSGGTLSNIATAALAGVRGSGSFGLGDRLAAAGAYALQDGNASYDDILSLQQEITRREADLSPVGNILGTLVTGAGVARAGASAIGKLAAPLAARIGQAAQSGSRVAQAAQRAGRVAAIKKAGEATVAGQRVASALTKGAKARNIARLSTAGAGIGALDAAGTGDDVTRGAVYGAAAVPVTMAGAKFAEYATRPVRDALRMSGASNILKRFTSATREEIEALAERYRKRNNGEEPTIYELLPLQDREALQDVISRMPAGAREKLATKANARMAEVGPGFARQVEKQTAGRRTRDINQLSNRLAASRNETAPTPEEIALAERAVVDPSDIETLAKQEAGNIMAPFDDVTVVDNFDELSPTTLVQKGRTIKEIPADDQLAEALRGAAGPVRRRDGPQGVLVRDITEMISNLKANQNLPTGVRQRAVARLEEVLTERAPDAAKAAESMNRQFASGMRIAEGARAGRNTVLREDVSAASPATRQDKLNAFDTPEGEVGRGMGQAYALRRQASQAPSTALNQLDQIAENPTTQEAIARNLPDEAPGLVASAQDQRQVARSLSSLLDPERMGADVAGAGSESIATMLAGLSPAAMNYTRIRALASLNRFFRGLPESRANAIVDALFSNDPALRTQGLQMLDNPAGRNVIDDIVKAARSALVGGVAGDALAAQPSEIQPPQNTSVTNEPDYTQMSDEELMQAIQQGGEPDYTQMSDEELMQAIQQGGAQQESPYSSILQSVYENENPALIDLVERVAQQESQGQHFDNSGQPVRSKAGAIGIMQVMPATGPEAAKLAGVPWDEQAFYNDPDYNKILGIAYLSEMLRRYDGDVSRALAAYNAGPGAVDRATRSNVNWLRNLPSETRDYVEKVS